MAPDRERRGSALNGVAEESSSSGSEEGVNADANRLDATPGIVARVGLWSALGFVLNLTWEIGHVRLYTIWMEGDGLRIARAVFHCSLGDVVIALAAFVLTCLALRRADWPASRPWAGGAIAVIGAMVFTAWSEWYNVYRTGAWSYMPDMPTIYGIGLSPLLQWLIIPPVMVVAHGALLPVLVGKAQQVKR